MVNVRRLRRDTIQFNDGQVASLGERRRVVDDDVVAAEIEAVEVTTDAFDFRRQRGRDLGTGICKQTASAVRTNPVQGDALTTRRHIAQSCRMQLHEERRHADSALIVENQVVQRALAVALDRGRALVCQ